MVAISPRAREASAPILGVRMPVFMKGERPMPESVAKKVFIRSVALLSFALTCFYIAWRAGYTLNPSVWWIAIPLFLAEAHNGFGFLLFLLALWDRDVSPRSRPVVHTDYKIAVLIATYNEPEEILLPTIAGAVALQPPHETWVLDDGRRPDVKILAEGLGAKYLTRSDNNHAKAGKINHALSVITADIIAVFDADHVPTKDFLRNTLGYFDDPSVTVVQTPQDFCNDDSFEHEATGQDSMFNEEAIFYRVIAPAKNLWRAAFWCGTSAAVRVSALRAVGGVRTETVTEDIHTTMRLNRAGWNVVYHNEVLARGLAPSDAIQYLIQRNRWAKGAMQVLRLENPLTSHGFTFGQRLSFATTLFAWFDAWRTLAFMLFPWVIFVTGASPIAAPGYIYGPLFLSTFVLQFVSLRLLARGYYPPLLSLLFEVLRLAAVLPATLAVFNPKAGKFQVTPKGRSSGGRERMRAPRLLRLLWGGTLAGLGWFVLSSFGLTPTHYHEPAAAIGAAMFATMNMLLVHTAVKRIQSWRFAGERRASVRFEVELPAALDGISGMVYDISLTGARLHIPRQLLIAPGKANLLTITLPSGVVTLDVTICSQYKTDETQREVGVEFKPGQLAERAQLARAIFQGSEPETKVFVPQRLAA